MECEVSNTLTEIRKGIFYASGGNCGPKNWNSQKTNWQQHIENRIKIQEFVFVTNNFGWRIIGVIIGLGAADVADTSEVFWYMSTSFDPTIKFVGNSGFRSSLWLQKVILKNKQKSSNYKKRKKKQTWRYLLSMIMQRRQRCVENRRGQELCRQRLWQSLECWWHMLPGVTKPCYLSVHLECRRGR